MQSRITTLSYLVLFFILFQPLVIFSQNEKDTLTFIQAKKLSDEDLANKKEGLFVTGIPNVSSDPVTGFGIGINGNIYWNGKKDHPFFAYTPYLTKLKVNASYFSSNARELALSLDVPYYRGSRWRIKLDLKAQQNPANLYFGIDEATLGELRLPSTPTSQTGFATYDEFDEQRGTIRTGNNGEPALVSDVLSNQFRETEFLLNLKADYALGNGKWRILGGYEIQHLRYKTFEGTETEGTDPLTGETVTVPNGTSLLRRDFEQGLISGLDGGRVSIFQTALIFDTRDFEPDPTQGYYFEIANEYSSRLIGSQFEFDKLFIQGQAYKKLPWGKRTILAGRLGIGNIFGNNAPFFEFQDQWSPDGSVNALGGRQSLRGFRANRFLARSLWFFNTEIRTRLFQTKLGKQHFAFSMVPFLDVGTVRNRWQDLGFRDLRSSYGGGLRIAWNQSTVISFDYGVSREDDLFYLNIGQVF